VEIDFLKFLYDYKRYLTAIPFGLVLLWPSPAWAHLVNTGLGPFYDGLSHLSLTMEDFLPVIAIALFAGLRGPGSTRRTLWILPVGWLVGGVMGLIWGGPGDSQLTLISFVVFGGLVATDLKLSQSQMTVTIGAFSLFHGYLNGAAMAEAQLGLVGLLGIITAAFVLLTFITASVVSVKRYWMKIMIRVAGSWIAAIGLLLFGWSMRQ
jgi:hydrogenase/urease accessory protein HupE